MFPANEEVAVVEVAKIKAKVFVAAPELDGVIELICCCKVDTALLTTVFTIAFVCAVVSDGTLYDAPPTYVFVMY
jgi:hypothetical protein